MPAHANAREYHKRIIEGVLQELHSNRVAIGALRGPYAMFVFTGGEIPRGKCRLAAVASYLASPFAGERISTEKITLYRTIAEMTAGLGEKPAAPRPRTLRCRKEIGDAFSQASSEMSLLGTGLESTFTDLLAEMSVSAPQ
jgi:hypothetical protein